MQTYAWHGRHHTAHVTALREHERVTWSGRHRAPLKDVPELAAFLSGSGATRLGAVPPPIVPGRTAHEIDFRIVGSEMQFVEVELDPGESAVAEAGFPELAPSGAGHAIGLGPALELPAGTIASRISRCLAKLRVEMRHLRGGNAAKGW